tara:strand:+ start:624 stop:947 length:324 start_codon:yes stop_codon:yes gene_type:complete
MAKFDNVMSTFDKYIDGYSGNPPTTEEEYDVWKEKFPDVFPEVSDFPAWSDVKSKLDDEVVREKRLWLYPEVGEQFDLLWHAIDKGKVDKTSDFYKTLKKVKDDNPK